MGYTATLLMCVLLKIIKVCPYHPCILSIYAVDFVPPFREGNSLFFIIMNRVLLLYLQPFKKPGCGWIVSPSSPLSLSLSILTLLLILFDIEKRKFFENF